MSEQDSQLDKIEKMVKLNQTDQTKLITYYAKCPISVRTQVFDIHRDNFYKLRAKYKNEVDLGVISYCALLLSIGFVRATEKALTNKSFSNLSLDEVRNLSASRAIAFKDKTTKISLKHEKLMGYWAIVHTLRLDHGYSYERVSQYLKKKHRFSIAASTIMKKWKEIETPNTSENVS